MSARCGPLLIRGLAAGYARRPVLRSLDLDPLQPGELTALIGPNGAGKSTLLRVIAGLVPATGSVRLGEEDILPLSGTERARRLAFMPQASGEGASLTVLEAIIGAIRVAPGPPEEAERSNEERAMAVLDRLGVPDLAVRPLLHLSGGQRQLASLAQTLAVDAPVLLLDEPTSALDLRFQFEVMRLSRDLAREGRIVAAVLHDLALACQWADRLIVLKDGRVQCQGRPEDVVTPAMLAAVYGVEARVVKDDFGGLHVRTTGTLG